MKINVKISIEQEENILINKDRTSLKINAMIFLLKELMSLKIRLDM